MISFKNLALHPYILNILFVSSWLQPPQSTAKHRSQRGEALLPSVHPGREDRQDTAVLAAGGLRRHIRQEGDERPHHHEAEPVLRLQQGRDRADPAV